MDVAERNWSASVSLFQQALEAGENDFDALLITLDATALAIAGTSRGGETFIEAALELIANRAREFHARAAEDVDTLRRMN